MHSSLDFDADDKIPSTTTAGGVSLGLCLDIFGLEPGKLWDTGDLSGDPFAGAWAYETGQPWGSTSAEERADVMAGNSELIEYGKKLDPTRLWVHVSNSYRKGENTPAFYQSDDVLAVNAYPVHWLNPGQDEFEKGYLFIKRDLFRCPGNDRLDGSAHIIGDRGFLFLLKSIGTVLGSLPVLAESW